MHLGRRDRVHFPDTYKGFRLVRTHGRVWGIPPAADPARVMADGELFTHPAVENTATLDEMRELIDGYDADARGPQPVGHRDGYDLLRHRGQVHAVPTAAGAIDLDRPDDRARAGVVSGRTRAEVEAALARQRADRPVEFAGWLPIYDVSGNCGKHPQFTHTGSPPPGYRFTRSAVRKDDRPSWWARRVSPVLAKAGRAWRAAVGLARIPVAFFRPCPGVTLRGRVRVFFALVRLVVLLLRRGVKPFAAAKFVQSRHLQSQLLMGEPRELVFLTSMPYTYGQNPWVIEIEDPTTLFYPLVQNGQTAPLDVQQLPYVPAVKALLEADPCKAIVTHIKSTAELVPTLFGSDIIRDKVVYAPLGVKVPARWQRHAPKPVGEPIDLLFINSWCQVPSNFYLRGGLDILEAFAVLKDRYPQLRLTMRTALPPLADHYKRILEAGWVRVVDRFVTSEEMADLHVNSDIYLLPAARVHIVSLLQAMSYGLPVVASDGWGLREYVDDGRNGLVVPGRYGVSSWADEEAGLLREDYETMYTPNPEVVAGIVEAVSRLVEDHELRARLGRAARSDVETRYNLTNWNAALKTAFDKARGVTPEVAGRVRGALLPRVPVSRRLRLPGHGGPGRPAGQ